MKAIKTYTGGMPHYTTSVLTPHQEELIDNLIEEMPMSPTHEELFEFAIKIVLQERSYA
jgi:hypothetical protein